MSNDALVTRPDYDITTKYLFHWTEQVLKIALQKGFHILDLPSTKATRKNYDSYQNKWKPGFIFVNGHGNERLIAGHDNEPLISIEDSDLSKYKGSIIYARSCKSAVALGPKLVDSGLSAYIGYTQNFVFFHSSPYAATPIKDPVSRIFLNPSNLVASSIIKGNTVGSAHARSIKAMKKTLRRMLSSASTPDERDMAPYLWSNINAQVIIGDQNAKINTQNS